MDALLTAVQVALTPENLLAISAGTIFGLIFGAIPGLTFSVALAIILPFTFALETPTAISLLLSTYIGGMTGGTVSAILLGIPGTPSAAATVADGYALAKKGKASLALGLAVIVSTFGGLVSLVIMAVSVDLVARMAIRFGPAEIFALVLFGFSTICAMAEKSLLKGLIAGILGLMIMTVGYDEIGGAQRLTFGITEMLQGVNLLVAMIGLFAIPHIIIIFTNYVNGGQTTLSRTNVSVELPRWRDLKEHFWLMVRCAGIGTGIGAIPGTGGPVASFLAYDHAHRFSKHPEEFGKGSVEGVIAPETANNAVTGGAMIPLLSLGIPGDPATAIILSGLLIHGLVPGPMLFIQHTDQIYMIYMAFVMAYLAVTLFQLIGIRFFVQVLRIPPHLLAVAIIVMCVIGAFSIRNSAFDIYTLAVIGLFGYLLIRVNIPLTPIILGLVLGPTLEKKFRTAMILSEGDLSIFYTSPVALLFFSLTLLVIARQIRVGIIDRRNRNAADIPAHKSEV